jgi:hypothetical protein
MFFFHATGLLEVSSRPCVSANSLTTSMSWSRFYTHG